MKLIDKDALVAEIESKKKYAQTLGDNAINNSMQQFYDGMKQGCVDILSTIDTIEVKEVDLEKEIKEEYLKRRCYGGKDNMIVILSEPKFNTIAKHFFELGLKAQKKE